MPDDGSATLPSMWPFATVHSTCSWRSPEPKTHWPASSTSGRKRRFLAGERAEVVQREAGHEHISTTLGYPKEVQDRRGAMESRSLARPAMLLDPSQARVTNRNQAVVLVFQRNVARSRRFSPIP